MTEKVAKQYCLPQMTRFGRRWLLFFSNASLPLITVGLSIYLKMVGQDLWHLPTFILLAAVFLLNVIAAYHAIIRPFRDIDSVAGAVFEAMSPSVFLLGQQANIGLRLNILLLYRSPKWLFLRKYLKIYWGANMRNQPDVGISFPSSKGVAGEVCCKRKTPMLVNTEASGHERWGFTKKEIEKYQLNNVKAIYSWPIYAFNRGGDQTGEVIGALNLDSTTPGASAKIAAQQTDYDEFLESFSELASKILS